MRTKWQLAIGTGLLATFIAFGSANAQDANRFAAMDTNGDSAISKGEATDALAAQYERLDANHDGVVSKDEFIAGRLAELSQLDTDHDGQISRAELRDRFVHRLFGGR